MKNLSVVLLLLFAVPAFCQVPRPYVFGGVTATGGLGYQPFAPVVGGGVAGEYEHWLFSAEGLFDIAHKVNDGTGQDSGYTERAGIHGFVRIPGHDDWFVGPGASYTFLHTVLYSKNGWHPRAAVGWDKYYWGRFEAEYVFAGTDHINAVQGPQVNLWFPNPRTAGRHWFYRETIALDTFHDTTPARNRHLGSEVQFTVEYRF